MSKDPIVAEIHRVREELWHECHGSTEEMAERQRNLQKQNMERLIDPDQWKLRRKTEKQDS